MAAITGITGTVTWAGTGIQSVLMTNDGTSGTLPVSFDLQAPIDSFDTTAFNVTQEADMTPGLASWSGTITAQLPTPSIGTAGSVTIPSGYAANINGWTMNIVQAAHDVTDFTAAAAGWKTFIGGLVQGTGTYTGWYDSSTAAVAPGTISSAVFTVLSSVTLTTNIIQGYQITSVPAAPNTIAYNYVTDGTITAATTANNIIVPNSTSGTGWVEAATQLVLTTSTSQTFTGNAIWTSINIARPAASPGIITIGFQGTGALAAG